MRVEKCGSARRQTVDMRCFGHRMPPEVADPVILVINRNE